MATWRRKEKRVDKNLPMAATDSIASKILLDIRNYGWHRMGVSGPEGRPSWVYSIGFHRTYQHPEIVVFGFDRPLLMGIMGTIGELVGAGATLAAETESADILEDFNCAFRTVDKRWYPVFFGRAIDFYAGDDFPVLQRVYPGGRGLYPWQQGFDEALRDWQPRLATDTEAE